MQKIILSLAALATVLTMATAEGDIAHPYERIDTKKETVTHALVAERDFLNRFHFKNDLRLRYESIERIVSLNVRNFQTLSNIRLHFAATLHA